MTQVTTEAYQDLRNYIQENWKYVELQDEAGKAIIRLSPSDSRVSWVHVANAQILKLQVIIKGNDPDIVAPKTFAKSAIYKVATGGSPYSLETFTPSIIAKDDEITIIHSIQVPVIV